LVEYPALTLVILQVPNNIELMLSDNGKKTHPAPYGHNQTGHDTSDPIGAAAFSLADKHPSDG
jgi:hypothetical protein